MLVTKRYKIQNNEEDQDVIYDITRMLEETVISWIMHKMIAGVKNAGTKKKERNVLKI